MGSEEMEVGHHDDGRWYFWTTTTDEDSRKVRVEEMLRVGDNVHLKTWDREMGSRGGYRTRSLRFAVRDEDSGGLIDDAVEKAKAKARAARRRREHEGGEDGPLLHEPTLEAVFGWWKRERLPHRKRQVSEDTVQRDLRAPQALMRVWGEDFRLEDFNQTHVDQWVHLRTTGRVDAWGRHVDDPEERVEVSVPVAVESLNRLRRMCEWASSFLPDTTSERTLLESNPFGEVNLPKGNNGGGKSEQPHYGDTEVEALLEVAPRVRVGGEGRGSRKDEEAVSYLRTLIALAYWTGRRIGAIVPLRWSDWDPDRGDHGYLRWRAEEDKVDREWWAPVTEAVRDALRRHRQQFPGVGGAFLFRAPRSEGHLRTDVAREWLRRAEKLTRETDDVPSVKTIPGRAWHGFRRLWVTKRKHLPRADVAATGGWVDPSTLDIYERADPETMQQVVDEGERKRVER